MRERRGGIEKPSGSIGFREAGNSGHEAGFTQVESKIRDRRENELIVGAEEGGKHRRHAFL